MSVTVQDVTYLRDGELELQASVYTPAGSGPFPCLLDVHGGAWVRADRHSNQTLDTALAEAGFLVVAVDFRQPPAHPYPAFAIDVNFAVRWLKSHAVALGGDPTRVAILGASSGGHIALLTAVRPFDAELASRPETGADAAVPCVVACWAISDPSARYAFAQQTGNARLVASHEATFVPFTRMEEANPRLIVERGDAQRLPPVLILQGTADNNVTPAIQAGFQRTYQAAGGQCEVAIFEGQAHGFGNEGAEGTRLAVERIVPFLEQHIGSAVSAAGARGGS